MTQTAGPGPSSAPQSTWEPVVIWSKPENERPDTPLLVLLHGHLANEDDLMGILEFLPEEFTVASVRAPIAMGSGFTWFPFTPDARGLTGEVIAAVDNITGWVDSVRTNHSSVSLLGFSMGMAIASSMLRIRPLDYCAVVGLSGFAIDSEGSDYFRDDEVKANPVPFFWGRDQEDPVITADRIEFTHGWLNGHAKLTKVLYAGMFHSINVQELGHVREFLQMSVPGLRRTPLKR